MAQPNEHLDHLVLEARRSAETRAQGYRAQALKLYPWVCGRCARTFDQANLQLLEVHHKNNNHHDNPVDGSNWELLCTYCHENEHSKVKDLAGRCDGDLCKIAGVVGPTQRQLLPARDVRHQLNSQQVRQAEDRR